jgi:hypothetical protein
MPKRTLILGLLAATAIIVGLAVGFFELTIAGIVAAAVAAALWLRTRSA